MSNPKISVLMPVYNAKEDEFRTAIESILNQTFQDFEFIIINDGSTSNVEDVVLSYNDDRIVYVRNEQNLKIIKTLNKGLALAKGEYIARLDSDDWSDVTRLEKQARYLDENPKVGLLGTFYTHMPENRAVETVSLPPQVRVYLRYCRNCILHSAAMYRKSVLEQYNLKYNECCLHAEDYMLWSDISRVAEVAVYPENLTYYRTSLDGISHTNGEFQNMMMIIVILGNIIEDFPCDKDYLYSIQMKYARHEVVTETEYYTISGFLKKVAKAVSDFLPAEYSEEVTELITGLPGYFIKSKYSE